jgi:TatA/E family protein of Tat protein translocase
MFGIGGWEMLLIAVVALLVFGPKRLPELARQMGKGLAEFRRASSDLRRSFDLELDPTRTPAPAPETQPPAQAGDVAQPLPPGKPDAVPDPDEGLADKVSDNSHAQAHAQADNESETPPSERDPEARGG